MFYQASFAVILMFWQQWTGTNSINYYAPQIFSSIGLKSNSAGLFATGIYGVVKIVCTALGLAFATEQMGRKVCVVCHNASLAWLSTLGLHLLTKLSPFMHTDTTTSGRCLSDPLDKRSPCST